MKRRLFTLLAVVPLVLMPGPNSGQVLRSSPVEGTWQFSGFLELMQLESFRNGLLAGMIGLPNGPQFDLTGDLDGEAIELEVAIPDQKRAITFKGTIKGDRMTLTRAVVIHDGGARGDDGIFGAGGPSKVTATRVEARGRISGRVVDKASGKPLKNASVSVSRFIAFGARRNEITGEIVPTFNSDPGPSIQAMSVTSGDGSFTVTGLPPGDYQVTVTADHYRAQDYGAREPDWRGLLVRVGADARVKDIQIGMTRNSVITGTIVDHNGKPMPNVKVQAYFGGKSFLSGEWRLSPRPLILPGLVGDASPAARANSRAASKPDPLSAGRQITDRAGRYRLEDLEPGDYYVMADTEMRPLAWAVPTQGANRATVCFGEARGLRGLGGRSKVMLFPPPDGPVVPGPSQTVFVPVFYPGSFDPRAARTVRVPAASTVQGIDFTLRPTRTAEIRGVVAGAAAEGSRGADTAETLERAAPACVAVGLLPLSPPIERGFGASPNTTMMAVTEKDGTFQFSGVVPGAYRVVALWGWKEPEVSAIQDIVVEAGDAARLSLALRRGVAVRVRAVFDTPAPPDFKFYANLRPAEDRLDSFLSTVFPARYPMPTVVGNSNGQAVIPGVIPDRAYFINRGGTIASVRYGDTDVTRDNPAIIRDENATFDVHYDFRLGRIEVIVTDEGKPKPDVVTTLTSPQGILTYPPDLTDERGRVAFDKVAPGDYVIHAWENWTGSSFFEVPPQFRERGRAVHVERGQTVSESVPIIRVERAVLK